MLCKHLEWRDSSNPSNNFAYATMMIGHATSLLYNGEFRNSHALIKTKKHADLPNLR